MNDSAFIIQLYRLSFISWLAFCFVGILSCKHDPSFMLMDDDMMPNDTMMIDTTITNPPDTMATEPCDPDIVYFDQEILPILISNCAFSGCHDDASAEDGVILTSYEKVIETADVEPFNLDDSEIYEVLVDDDEVERMPPAPTDRLSSDKINLIAKWILQGGKDLDCDPNASGCDTDNVSFSQIIQPVIQNTCEGCHSGPVPSGGIDLSDHTGIQSVALDGRLIGAVDWQPGFEQMPQGGAKLDDCFIDQLEAWIADGAPDN